MYLIAIAQSFTDTPSMESRTIDCALAESFIHRIILAYITVRFIFSIGKNICLCRAAVLLAILGDKHSTCMNFRIESSREWDLEAHRGTPKHPEGPRSTAKHPEAPRSTSKKSL
jgi:hypothetical protein